MIKPDYSSETARTNASQIVCEKPETVTDFRGTCNVYYLDVSSDETAPECFCHVCVQFGLTKHPTEVA